jgi:hypothetical protein
MKSIDKPAVPAEHLAVAPLAHAMTTQRLAQKRVAQVAQNGVFSVALATHFWDPTIWSDLLQLQTAIWLRLQKQNQDWQKGCKILAADYAQIKQANTMSKLLEKQCNLMSQSALLLTNQGTNFVALLENIDVDYGYWASQKLQS